MKYYFYPFIYRSKQVVHLETRIQFELLSKNMKSRNHTASVGVSKGTVVGGQDCLLANGETATCMDFIACQKYTGIGLSDELGLLLYSV